MPVITISRGSYSRGKEIAEALAKELDYQCMSRDVLLEASDQFNIPEIKLVKALHDAPSVLERFHFGREKYISYFMSTFLSHIANGGNIVYHGLAGHFFLQDISHVLKVRINAKMSDRILEEMRREKCSESTARYNLQRDDEERRRWGMQLYGKDTWDSRLYDVVFCVDTLTVPDIVEMLAMTVRKNQYQETEQSLSELNKRAFAANIAAQVTSFSPRAKVRVLDNSSIELSNVDSRLRNDLSARQEFAEMLRIQYDVPEVFFKDPAQSGGHVNNFHNIKVQ